MNDPNENHVQALLNELTRTKPDFGNDIGSDKIISVLMRLAMEISVLRDRLATQEALLKEHDLLGDDDIDVYEISAEEGQRRVAEKMALIQSIVNDLR